MDWFMDLDGTMIGYSTPRGVRPTINEKLIDQLMEPGDRVVIVTNQGGIPYSFMGRNQMPTPQDFVDRVAALAEFLASREIAIKAVYVCVYHPYAEEQAIKQAANGIRDLTLGKLPRFVIFYGANARKPSGMMLRLCRADRYFGDSDEDMMAALDAGVPFTRVERFTGGE